METHKERIKQRIKESINRFKNREIDYNLLAGIISANIGALDNIDKELESAKWGICGKLEIIHFTVDSDKEFAEMLKEVEKFEKLIDKNL